YAEILVWHLIALSAPHNRFSLAAARVAPNCGRAIVRRSTVTAALAGVTAMLLSAPGSTRPIYMKYDDIKGEATGASGHDAWIELVSVSIAPEARSGVKIAAGDATGDG